ncbi:MAG: DUF2384 domain-containing protein [Gammaproteobacteria bacterium]|nr:DUF2384 domain-containing protein [Gammaproteobacteria bacterium]
MSEFTKASQEDRVYLTRSIISLLESWGIGLSEQVVILALPSEITARNMRRYQTDTPFPDDPDVLERIEHLIGIADALRTTFPRNPQMGPLWMHRRNKHFRRRTPVNLMVEDGLDGVIAVRTHLDCSFAWASSGSTAG